jgi:hypothetical protein
MRVRINGEQVQECGVELHLLKGETVEVDQTDDTLYELWFEGQKIGLLVVDHSVKARAFVHLLKEVQG